MSWLDGYFKNNSQIASVPVNGARTIDYSTGLSAVDDGTKITVKAASYIGLIPVDTNMTSTGTVTVTYDSTSGRLLFTCVPA
jgi:hypothetical protein